MSYEDRQDSEYDFLKIILNLLTISKAPDDELLRKAASDNAAFEKICEQLSAIRMLSFALCKGDLDKTVPERGFILSNLKALQSTLRHLTWQTKKIADGDYSQKIEFLGDFSIAFNQMTDKLRIATEQLVDLAYLDNLTKIPNRLALNKFFEREFTLAKRQHTEELSAFLFDIDFFKQINDTYGHDAGDRILIQFTQILSKQFRSTDIFARYGGEEFIAVLPGIKFEDALTIGERALKSIETTDFIIEQGKIVNITVSIGISRMHHGDETYEDLIKRSDNALYEAKSSGRNCIRVRLSTP